MDCYSVFLRLRSTMRASSKPRFGVVLACVFLFVAVLFMLALFLSGLGVNVVAWIGSRSTWSIFSGWNNTPTSQHRKLLGRLLAMEPNRMWGEKCTTADIVVNQGPTSPLPSGIPTYTVEVMNVCVTGCDIARIHLSCGWFSSARLINPKIFKRLRYNDCVVNDGKPLVNGGTLSFQYANTYLYPLSVSSVAC